MLKVVASKLESKQEVLLTLDEVCRQAAQEMLKKALQLEAEEYINKFTDVVDEQGHRMVVKNGFAKERTITAGSGAMKVNAPRVDDRREGEKFISKLLPPYLRKSPKVESLLPLLYLKGLSTNDFKSAFAEFLGEGTMGLSPASIVKLKKMWEDEYKKWQKRAITNNHVYIWADGVNVQVRLGEDKKVCLLVIIGVTASGDKELLSVSSGYRESKESWLSVLRDLVDRGFKAPLVAVGDGALGFWAAIRECDGFQKTQEQRCWVHKIANVLDKLPKRLQSQAKGLLHEMMQAPSKKDCEKARDQFVKNYEEKYPKATACLMKHWDQLITFFSFPAMHWQHIRTTNPIESSFATVKLRTKVTKGAGSKETAAVMAFKLLQECESTWRKIRGHKELQNLLNGVEYKDGVVVANNSHSESAA